MADPSPKQFNDNIFTNTLVVTHMHSAFGLPNHFVRANYFSQKAGLSGYQLVTRGNERNTVWLTFLDTGSVELFTTCTPNATSGV